jgi:transcriptional regulator
MLEIILDPRLGKGLNLPYAPGLVDLLKVMTDKFESGSRSPWEFELPEDLLTADTLCSAIVGFEISVDKIDAKFKLSQNRGQEDKVGILDGLSERSDDMSRAIRKLMTE